MGNIHPAHLQSSTISNIFLKIAYTGDVARLSANGYLLDDNFNNGLPWMIGLRRFITENRRWDPLSLAFFL